MALCVALLKYDECGGGEGACVYGNFGSGRVRELEGTWKSSQSEFYFTRHFNSTFMVVLVSNIVQIFFSKLLL